MAQVVYKFVPFHLVEREGQVALDELEEKIFRIIMIIILSNIVKTPLFLFWLKE